MINNEEDLTIAYQLGVHDERKRNQQANSDYSPSTCSAWGMLEGIELGIKKLGYRLSCGTWLDIHGEEVPTLNIDRPDDPTWEGVWSTTDDMDELSVAMLLFVDAYRSWEDHEGFE